MKIYRQIYVLLILFPLIASCTSQHKVDEPKNDNINAEPKATPVFLGPSSITRTIKQDKKGNIWFASWEGIVRYDGNSIVNMTSDVSASRFFSVLEDYQGNFWFGSIGSGVYYYNGVSFRNYTTNEGLANDNVLYVYEDKSGRVWFATQGGVSFYDGKTFHNFTTTDGLPHNDTTSIIEDRYGKIWVGTSEGVGIYDGKTFTNFMNNEGLPFNNVRSIIEDMNGHIWLGGEDGLWRYDGITLSNVTTVFVGYVYEDKKGSIWTSSQGIQGWDVTRYDKNPLFYEIVTANKIWTDAGMVFGILEDNKGGIWFGTLNGYCQYDGITVKCHNKVN